MRMRYSHVADERKSDILHSINLQNFDTSVVQGLLGLKSRDNV